MAKTDFETELIRLENPDIQEKTPDSAVNNGCDDVPEREHWDSKVESFLSLVGYCVGIGNIWRFPFFCMRNGGGSFLLAFVFFLVVCGLPLYFIDMAIGQFTGKTAFHAWEICPVLKGLGPGVLIVNFIISTYYTTVMSWIIYYLGMSFFSPLPWTTCGNNWNTNSCITDGVSSSDLYRNASVSIGAATTPVSPVNSTNMASLPMLPGNESKASVHAVTSVEEFWHHGVLELSSGLEDLGTIPWHLAVCLLAAWSILFLCLIRGIHSSGKAVYVTASLPYILLTILLIRASLLPGAGDGVLYYITPDWKKLGELQVWLEAALQVFYSLGAAWGPIITLASYNKFSNNCYRDSIILTLISEGTSIFGGFVVFAVVGYMAHETGMPISEVVTLGPGLVFMSYPETLAQLPLPNLWSVLFFLMLLAVILDSQMETLVTALLDQFPRLRRRRLVVHVLGCVTWFCFGLLMITQGGMYIFYLLDWYVGLSIPVFGVFECIIVGWIYGTERFSRDVSLMIGHGIPVLMRFALCFVVPVILLFISLFAFATYKSPSYGEYQYPSYAITIGLFMGVIPFVPVVVMAFLEVVAAPGNTVFEKLANSTKPSSKWKPASKTHAKNYEYADIPEYSEFWSRLKINIFGPRKH